MTRRLKKRFVPATLLVVIIIYGCATKEGYRNVVDAWVGQPESALISAWGLPQRTYETDTSKVLIYYSQRDVDVPGSTNTYQRYFDETGTAFSESYGGVPDQTFTYSCETSFEVIDGVITSWSFRGNDCVAKQEN